MLFSRKLTSLGHDARLMPAKYVRPYSRGQKNDFRDAEAIAEAMQRPTMKFVATNTAEQAGYIDARPHISQLGEIFLQRMAGPYIGSRMDGARGAREKNLTFRETIRVQPCIR